MSRFSLRRLLTPVSVALLLSTPASHAADPPVKRVFDTWLATFTAGNKAALLAQGTVVGKSIGEYDNTGGVDVVAADANGSVVMAFVKAKKDGKLYRVEFLVSSDTPPLPLLVSIRPVASLPKATANGWQRVDGGADTGCALGTPFHFYFRAGNPKKLAIHLQGGGACWNAATCHVGEKRWFDHSVDDRDDPTFKGGVFDLTRADNPFRDYSILFIPYCTADVHMGRRDAEYALKVEGGIEAKLKLRHNGANNVNDALAWLNRQMPAPEAVVVMGESAGSIASPVYAARIATHFPAARITQLGDGSGIYRSAQVAPTALKWSLPDVLRGEAAYRSLDPAALSHELYYILASRHAPRIRFAQINSAEDAVQVSFLEQLGEKNIVPTQLMKMNFADVSREVKNHRTYTIGGKEHTILFRSTFYSTVVDGTPLKDWVANLIEDKEIGNVGESLLK